MKLSFAVPLAPSLGGFARGLGRGTGLSCVAPNFFEEQSFVAFSPRRMLMQVSVTGAAGFVGQWLTRALIARGDRVRVLERSAKSAIPGAEVVRGDVTQPSSLQSLVKGCDVVFHLAGVRRGATRDDFMKVNAVGTELLAKAMLAHGARRLVLCGSLAAAGPSLPQQPKTESDEMRPTEWYGESKAEAERIALSYQGRLETTVSRPSRILGPGDVENRTFLRLAARGVALKILGPERRFSFVDVDDVVRHLLLLGSHARAPGEAFFCASNETWTVAQLMSKAAQLMGLKVRVVPVPQWVLRGLGGAADVVTQVTGYRLPINRKLAKQLLATGWECSIEKSTRMLGFEPKVTVTQALQRSLE